MQQAAYYHSKEYPMHVFRAFRHSGLLQSHPHFFPQILRSEHT